MNLQLAIISILFLFFCENQCSSIQLAPPDIYWREYTGVIPDDAVPGGVDSNKKITYIGQGYVKGRGIIPGVIYFESRQMTAPSFGTNVINSHLKILCSSVPNDLKWIPVQANNFHLATINKYVIRGGEETNHVVYIGRVTHQGQVITGKIVSGPFEAPGKAPMYFVYGNKEIRVESYEVLVFDAPYTNITPRIA